MQGEIFTVTFIYGHPKLEQRHRIWTELQKLGSQINHRWVCIGDFNQVLQESDKFTFKDHAIAGNQMFQQILSDLCLMPIASKGLPFTWMNKRQGEAFVMEKLDRAFANTAWLDHFSHSIVHNLPIIRSDHGPIILDTEYTQPYRHRPFRFEWMWTTHPDCATIINLAWSKKYDGSHAYILGKKINTIKDDFSKWNKAVFGMVERDIEKKRADLQCFQENINSVEDVKRESQHREQLEQLLDRKEMLWAQKARKEWDLKGDRNTKYYQAVVKNRKRHNRIIQIKNEEDVWITDQNQIEQCFCNHFRTVYADTPQYTVDEIQQQLSCLQLPTLTNQQKCTLDQPLEDAEIIQAIHQLGSLKAPGPDGIPAAFYQKFWTTVQHDVLHMVKAFFHSGFLLKSLNHTFITLIPKVPTPERVTQFRPISLCNVSYKIISKILVNRLKPLMDNLITPFQNAFIQGRQITDNIILAHEVFEYLKKKKIWKMGICST